MILSEAQRDGRIMCDGLRGRLPGVDELTVEEIGKQWIGAEAWGQCQNERANSIVRTADEFNARWEAYANGRH